MTAGAQVDKQNATVKGMELVQDIVSKEEEETKFQTQETFEAGKTISRPKRKSLMESFNNSVQQMEKNTIGVAKEVSYDDCREVITFARRNMATFEDNEEVEIIVRRWGQLKGNISVRYFTRNGTAESGSDYIAKEGRLVFKTGEREKSFFVELLEDKTYEEDETFDIILEDVQNCYGDENTPTSEKARDKTTPIGLATELGIDKMTITIINVDFPGVFIFESQHYSVCESEGHIDLTVKRIEGCSGTVACDYECLSDSAIEGSDFITCKGTLKFEHGEVEKTIRIEIIDDQAYEKDEDFHVELSNPTGDARFPETTNGGTEKEIAIITIISDENQTKMVDKAMAMLNINRDRIKLGTGNWKQQFVEAYYVLGGDEGATPTTSDYFIHICCFPWKMMFALCPPTDFLGGWVSFVTSLGMIGLVTALVGDTASLFGCCIGVPDSVTAITFVALGTSLPDTFASHTAAVMDANADASIGNITGSNSVNVFLGLGIPWLWSAMFWASEGPTDEWLDYVDSLPQAVKTVLTDGGYMATGAFVVPAGNLGFSVVVFSCCCCTCIAILYARRLLYGGELGGPKKPQIITALIFVLLWITYITLASARGVELI
jgi:solute carrier family 8 (sodium/calcium exchanger)